MTPDATVPSRAAVGRPRTKSHAYIGDLLDDPPDVHQPRDYSPGDRRE